MQLFYIRCQIDRYNAVTCIHIRSNLVIRKSLSVCDRVFSNICRKCNDLCVAQTCLDVRHHCTDHARKCCHTLALCPLKDFFQDQSLPLGTLIIPAFRITDPAISHRLNTAKMLHTG